MRTNAVRDVWKGETCIYCWDSKLVWPLWNSMWRFLKSQVFSFTLGHFLKDSHPNMFIVPLFILAREWIQPRCPSIDEWIMKM